MLCKLAWGNVRRAGRDYLVYLLTLTLGVTVFYALALGVFLNAQNAAHLALNAQNGAHSGV